MRPVKVMELAGEIRRRGQKVTTHTLLLQDDAQRQFRLPLEYCEALGIRVSIQNELVPRPITHDLIANVLTRLGAKVDHVTIERAGSGCRAKIMVNIGGSSYPIEANHGDAIALALRSDAIIYATEDLIGSADDLGEP